MRKHKILIIDNYDSFTYNLYDYFLQLGVECEVVRNNVLPLTDFQAMSFDGLVLSPGPKRPADAGHLMALIDHFHDKKPILGICLGHQAIGEYFGAKLVKSSVPMHGKTSQIIHTGQTIFQDVPQHIAVMRYHSLTLKNLENTPLRLLANTNDGEIMAIGHQYLPIFGIQFHPESILTDYGLEMLDNWLSSCVRVESDQETLAMESG